MVHLLFTKPLVQYVAEIARQAGIARVIVVVGHDADEVRRTLGEGFEYALQQPQLGTAHALMAARPLLAGFHGDVVVFVGDAPLLSPAVVRQLVEKRRARQLAATLLTAVFEKRVPPYGRILRDAHGRVTGIVEEKDATPEQKKIAEVNVSLYCFDAPTVLPLLDEIRNANASGEFYLTDIAGILHRHGLHVDTLAADDPRFILGVNNRFDLVEVFKAMRERIIDRHLANGVTILDPANTYVDDSVEIEPDAVILPFTFLQQNSRIGRSCRIGPFVRLSNTRVAPECEIQFSNIEDRDIEPPGRKITFENFSAVVEQMHNPQMRAHE